MITLNRWQWRRQRERKKNSNTFPLFGWERTKRVSRLKFDALIICSYFIHSLVMATVLNLNRLLYFHFIEFLSSRVSTSFYVFLENTKKNYESQGQCSLNFINSCCYCSFFCERIFFLDFVQHKAVRILWKRSLLWTNYYAELICNENRLKIASTIVTAAQVVHFIHCCCSIWPNHISLCHSRCSCAICISISCIY